MTDKDKNQINEVEDEIKSALEDPRGVVVHQKRLAFCLSLGIINLFEKYLISKSVFKKGMKLNHQWFKKKKENVKSILKTKVFSLDKLDKLDKILEVAYNIESKRNELAYGKDVSENVLNDLINQYLDIKKEIENEE